MSTDGKLDDTSIFSVTSPLPTAGASDFATRNELLCFVQQKSGVIAADQLVKVCADFYRKEEILTARTAVEQYCAKRLPRRQGADANKNTMEDILKICLDPEIKLPTFYATDLSRLPPVDADHCDVSIILRELQSLRAEVRAISDLRAEVDVLRQEVIMLKSQYHQPQMTDNTSAFVSAANDVQNTMTGTDQPSFAGHARSLRESGVVMKKKPRPVVVGASAKYSNLKTVITKRDVNIFASRWDPHTTTAEVRDCVDNILQGNYKDTVICTRLKAKYEHLYSSFYVRVSVPAEHMRNVIDKLMCAESWPSGLLITRYFPPQDG